MEKLSSSSDDESGDSLYCKYSLSLSTISAEELSREPLSLLQAESYALSPSVCVVVKSPMSITPKCSVLSSI